MNSANNSSNVSGTYPTPAGKNSQTLLAGALNFTP